MFGYFDFEAITAVRPPNGMNRITNAISRITKAIARVATVMMPAINNTIAGMLRVPKMMMSRVLRKGFK